MDVLLKARSIALLSKARGVKNWADKIKAREPGFFYPDFNEFGVLNQEFRDLKLQGVDISEVDDIMEFLQKELEETQRRIGNPVRNDEEETFYRHIVGINSYICEQKEINLAYIFDNEAEVNGLLYKLGMLNTQDPDILAIMHKITRDIKLTILFNKGKDEEEKYQEKLNSFGIGVQSRKK